MAPKLIIRKNYKINNLQLNFLVKKLNRSSIIINQLKKKISHLTIQNKELSTTRNNLLLNNLSLTNEMQKMKNTNIELTAKLHTISLKHGTLEQTIQKCVSALLTMSECVPSMLESVHEMSMLYKIDVKEEKQKKSVSPMVNDWTIMQPKVNSRHCDTDVLSPILELPNLEDTPNRPRKSSLKNSSNLKPNVRLKDVTAMLKNSKSVSNETKPNCQINCNLDESPGWLFNNDNRTQISEENNVIDCDNKSLIVNDMRVSIKNEISTLSEVELNLSTASNSSSKTNCSFNETCIMSPAEESMLKNVTCRKRQKLSSNNSSITSDVDLSNVSARSRRNTTPKVNYKINLKEKLRREK